MPHRCGTPDCKLTALYAQEGRLYQPRSILIRPTHRGRRWSHLLAQLGSALLLIAFGVALGIAWVGPFLHGLIVRMP